METSEQLAEIRRVLMEMRDTQVALETIVVALFKAHPDPDAVWRSIRVDLAMQKAALADHGYMTGMPSPSARAIGDRVQAALAEILARGPVPPDPA